MSFNNPKASVAGGARRTTGVVLLALALILFAKPVMAQSFANISGQVFEDLNFNQVLDYGEKALANWRVNLYQGEKLIARQITSSHGYYLFDNLGVGNYRLTLERPNTWAPVLGNNYFFTLGGAETVVVNFANYQMVRGKEAVEPILNLHTQSVEKISPTAVKITWHSSHPATSQVVLAKQPKAAGTLSLNDNNFSYQSSSAIDFEAVTYHSVILTDLDPATTYYYRLVALADPKQWRGASRVFSSEFSFTTAAATVKPDGSEGSEILSLGEETTKIAVQDLNYYLGRILAADFGQLGASTSPTSGPEIVVVGPLQPPAEGNPTSDCRFYIWLLLILNLITLGFIKIYGAASYKSMDQKLWWLGGIIVLMPLLMGYPDCWLTMWLLINLIAYLVLLFNLKKQFNLNNSTIISSPAPLFKTPDPKQEETTISPEPLLSLDQTILNQEPWIKPEFSQNKSAEPFSDIEPVNPEKPPENT